MREKKGLLEYLDAEPREQRLELFFGQRLALRLGARLRAAQLVGRKQPVERPAVGGEEQPEQRVLLRRGAGAAKCRPEARRHLLLEARQHDRLQHLPQ